MTNQQETPKDRIRILRSILQDWIKRIDADDLIDVGLVSNRIGSFPLPAEPQAIGNHMAPSGELALVVFARSMAGSAQAVAAVEASGQPAGGLVVPLPGSALRDRRN